MSPVQSPLFEPVLWQGSGFKILDEKQVPEEISYLEVSEVAQALAAVRDMRTRAFGQVLTFLYSGALIAERYSGREAEPLRAQLAQMTESFCEARPTFDFRGLGSCFDRWIDKLPDNAAAGESISRQAREFGQQIVRGRKARARRAAEILPSRARVLTHCNVSGELVAVAAHCKVIGKELSVFATETRPYLQGARLTAWELGQAGVSVSVIPDCAVAQVMAQGAVDAVIVGADRVAQNGDIINKVGTYPIARLAKEYGVPFNALVQDPRSLASGADVPIEERPAHEVLLFQGEPLVSGAGAGISARYPAFDVTPSMLITHLIGFDDLYTPETFRQKFQTPFCAAVAQDKPKRRYLLIYGLPPKGQYSFLVSALKAERAESMLVPEMRPQLWGTQIIARELLDRHVPTTVISDNMMGTLFAQGEISKLCFFYDELAEAGARGICGSLLAVQLARLHNVPVELFEATTPTTTPLDSDVSTFMGKKICPDGVGIWPVQSEIVPWALLKG